MNSKAVIAFGSLELIFCLFSTFSAASAVKKSKEGSKKRMGPSRIPSYFTPGKRYAQLVDFFSARSDISARSASFKKGLIRSMGMGKMVVEFFSVATSERVWR